MDLQVFLNILGLMIIIGFWFSVWISFILLFVLWRDL
jgi:hypothetical protein